MADKEMQAAQKHEQVAPHKAERLSEKKVFMPRTDIFETAEGLVVLADMPGVDEKSVDITLENDELTIRGKVEPTDFGKRTLAYAEYEIGDYERAFTLSQEIDREHIEASVRNGVLRLLLPKAAAAKTRKIAVKAQ